MADGIGRCAGSPGYQAVELDEFATLIADIHRVQLLRCESRGPLQLGDDFVLLAIDLEAAEVEATEENLEGPRNVLDGHPQRRGATAIHRDA